MSEVIRRPAQKKPGKGRFRAMRICSGFVGLLPAEAAVERSDRKTGVVDLERLLYGEKFQAGAVERARMAGVRGKVFDRMAGIDPGDDLVRLVRLIGSEVGRRREREDAGAGAGARACGVVDLNG